MGDINHHVQFTSKKLQIFDSIYESITLPASLFYLVFVFSIYFVTTGLMLLPEF
jgi:hypothetical protein